MTLSAVEFIGRFVRHILPKGFVRLRHYGLYASSQDWLRRGAQILLSQEPVKLDLGKWLTDVLGLDRGQCPFCGQGRMQTWRDFPPLHPIQMWLSLLLGIPVLGQEAQ